MISIRQCITTTIRRQQAVSFCRRLSTRFNTTSILSNAFINNPPVISLSSDKRYFGTTSVMTTMITSGCISISNSNSSQQHRTMASLMKPSTSIGSNPLDILLKECTAKKRCSDDGRRLKTTDHWTFSVAIGSSDPKQPPNLRTVSIERITAEGIDFVMKRTSSAAKSAVSGIPVSVLYQEGKFLPGQSAEQWRGEGYCEEIPLSDVIDLVPLYTATSMIASCRLNEKTKTNTATGEGDAVISDDRKAVLSRSRTTEVMQTTRNELENHNISIEEMERYIIALRFKPKRIEYMSGGPDTVMWDRWEWLLSSSSSDTNSAWADPKHLIPH